MNINLYRNVAPLLSAIVLYCAGSLAGEEINLTQVRDDIYMLNGQGGNVGLFVGNDGTFLIDDKFAPLTQELLDAADSVGGGVPKFLLNTHFHSDHTGGNENLGKAGALIVAQERVRERLSTDQVSEVFNRTTPASPEAALPVITFEKNVRFHWNGDTLDVSHIPHAHTDGDVIVHFLVANVIHTGDVVFNGMYPFIDAESGGSIRGMIEGVKTILALADEDTAIIPGHGKLMTRAELEEYRAMLEASAARVGALKEDRRTLEQIKALKPLEAYNAKWSSGFIDGDKWIELVYRSL